MAIRKLFMSEEYARTLIAFELATINGTEEAYFHTPGAIRGKVTLREVVEANKQVWLA